MISFSPEIYSTVTETVTVNEKQKRNASPLWSPSDRASLDLQPRGLLDFPAAIIKAACSCLVASTTTTVSTTFQVIATETQTVKLNEV